MVFEEITGAFIGTMDLTFAPVTAFSPIISLMFFSVLITVIIIILNRFSVNRTLMKQIKDKMEEIRENLTQAQKAGNKEETNKYLSELMKTNSEYMRQTIKTLIVSMVVIALFLPWLSFKYGGTSVAVLPFSLPIIGTGIGWIVWYALVSITIGWVIRKMIGMDYV